MHLILMWISTELDAKLSLFLHFEQFQILIQPQPSSLLTTWRSEKPSLSSEA